MKTTTVNDSRPLVDEVIIRYMLKRPTWEALGRDMESLDCYGFAMAVYGEGLGLPLVDFTGSPGDPISIARWFRSQRESWVELVKPLPYCLVALGRVTHITHVGVYHPSGEVYHLTSDGIVGQPIEMLHTYGYSLVKYYMHRSMVDES